MSPRFGCLIFTYLRMKYAGSRPQRIISPLSSSLVIARTRPCGLLQVVAAPGAEVITLIQRHLLHGVVREGLVLPAVLCHLEALGLSLLGHYVGSPEFYSK